MDASTTSRRSAGLFFVLAFAFTWSCWIPWSVWLRGLDGPAPAAPMQLLNLLGVFGPALAALLLTACLNGRSAVRALLSRLRQWRVGAVWYAVALLLWPLLLGAALLIDLALGGGVSITWAALLPQLIVALIVGVGEEIGWRGYALPALLRRQRPLTASLVLGMVWTAWHLPVWIAVQQLQGAALLVDLLVYAANLTSAAVVFTWLWLHTRGSLLPAVLLHAVFNASTTTALAGGDDRQLGYIISLLICAVAVAIVALERSVMLAEPAAQVGNAAIRIGTPLLADE